MQFANQVAIGEFLELNTIHYSAASKGRHWTDGKRSGKARHCTVICEQHQKVPARKKGILKNEYVLNLISWDYDPRFTVKRPMEP